MQFPTALAATVFALTVVACSSGSTTGTGPGTGPGTGTGTGTDAPGTAGVGTPAGGGDCNGACGYYLQCKGADSAENRAACNQQCVAAGFSPQQLSDFQQLDCPTAIAEIEHPTPAPGSSGGSSGGSAGGDCTNCAWDGSSCIWLSPSTGLSSACSGGAACCPGH